MQAGQERVLQNIGWHWRKGVFLRRPHGTMWKNNNRRRGSPFMIVYLQDEMAKKLQETIFQKDPWHYKWWNHYSKIYLQEFSFLGINTFSLCCYHWLIHFLFSYADKRFMGRTKTNMLFIASARLWMGEVFFLPDYRGYGSLKKRERREKTFPGRAPVGLKKEKNLYHSSAIHNTINDVPIILPVFRCLI